MLPHRRAECPARLRPPPPEPAPPPPPLLPQRLIVVANRLPVSAYTDRSGRWQLQVRPATPGAGLGVGGLHYDSSRDVGSETWQPQAANAVNTLRPRSAAAKVGRRGWAPQLPTQPDGAPQQIHGGGAHCQTSRPSLLPSCRPLQDRPLAVAPTQVGEAALAAARAEYVRETARIRAKRLREMQGSADLQL